MENEEQKPPLSGSQNNQETAIPEAHTLLLKDKHTLSFGDTVRYILTLDVAELLQKYPQQQSVWLKVKNTENVLLRSIYAVGPYSIYVGVTPEAFCPDKLAEQSYEVPVFKTDIKARNALYVELFFPPLTSDFYSSSNYNFTWTVDVSSQVVLGPGAKVSFDLSVGTTRDILKHPERRALVAQKLRKTFMRLKCLKFEKLGPEELWSVPPLQPKKPVHLVVLTHGIYSNLYSDMLYLKDQLEEHARRTGLNLIVRGYSKSAGETERGVKFLGTAMAEWLVDYVKESDLQISQVSFIAHSLGGLVQSYALVYIQYLQPDFFSRITPGCFITLASPLLGISHENPAYVNLALNVGIMGRSGTDLALAPSIPSIEVPDENGTTWISKPLLEWLPFGPLHGILLRFRTRTVYANIINDGIVPLRTSALLYLDWREISNVLEVQKQSKMRELESSDVREKEVKEEEEGKNGKVSMIENNSENPETDTETETEKEGVRHAPPEPQSKSGETVVFSLSNLLYPLQRLSVGSKPDKPRKRHRLKKIYRRSQVVRSPSSADTPASSASGSSGSLALSGDVTGKSDDEDEEEDDEEEREEDGEEDEEEDEKQEDEVENENRENGEKEKKEDTESNTERKERPEKDSKQEKKIVESRELGNGKHDVKPKQLSPLDTENLAEELKQGMDQEDNFTVPPKANAIISATKVLASPAASREFICNPASRPKTILHDRMYTPEEIPPPVLRRKSRSFLSFNVSSPTSTSSSLFSRKEKAKNKSKNMVAAFDEESEVGNAVEDGDNRAVDGTEEQADKNGDTLQNYTQPETDSNNTSDLVDTSNREERLARQWHRGMTWRKVLVKLEPDAHNNISVRRKFTNAYGWPVIDHLIANHFGPGS